MNKARIHIAYDSVFWRINAWKGVWAGLFNTGNVEHALLPFKILLLLRKIIAIQFPALVY
ncbi:MAG: hypothetical protein Ct9H300mP18_09680 [Candidatus Neomarinimicrobiota bacterium]|nr:MAG: hypothetical protein Ct9H300mP18_09680 [Candidatus Neomarinimicrobiota bacterium]